MKKKITPVILCGGSGTRLWPLSRKSYPKQFVDLVGELTLFQQSVLRLSSKEFNAPVIITNSDFRFIVAEQLKQICVEPKIIIIEPDGKNTAPAVLTAAIYLLENEPDSLLLISPSDHIISNQILFKEAIMTGMEETKIGQLVTFGIKPTHAETAYGYLEIQKPSTGRVERLKSFTEKPNKLDASKMFSNGSFLWNSGIFLFKVKDIINAFENHAPYLLAPVKKALETRVIDLDFCRIASEDWVKVKNISIDNAVMEKAQNISVVPFRGGWSDLGDWRSVWNESQKNSYGVVKSKQVTTINCENSLLRSESQNLEMVGIGLNNIIAVAMKDAVIIADMNCSQEIKKAVDILKSKNIEQSTSFAKDYRPWGWFETLVKGSCFKVKQIYISSGAAISLQSHKYRSEFWIVVEGSAKVTVDKTVKTLNQGNTVYIPLGAIHRLENVEIEPVLMIEVQIGQYLGEDDIIRYEDMYSRN